MQRKKTERPQIVVACTCRAVNHGWIKERRLYNLPLPKCGKLAFHENVGGIVVFVEAHPNLAFKARFKDVVDGAWLAKNGYSLAVKPHGEKYALYDEAKEEGWRTDVREDLRNCERLRTWFATKRLIRIRRK